MNTYFSLVQTGENSLDAQFGQAQAENIELWKQLSRTQAESTLLLTQLHAALDAGLC